MSHEPPKFSSPEEAMRRAYELAPPDLAIRLMDKAKLADLLDQLRTMDAQRDALLREIAPLLGLAGTDDWKGLRHAEVETMAHQGGYSATVELAMGRDPVRFPSKTRAGKLLPVWNGWLKTALGAVATDRWRRKAREG